MLAKSAQDHGADVILASEPNVNKTRRAGWFINDRCNCAINVVNHKNFKVTHSSAGDCFVRIDSKELSIYSCYLSFNDNRETYERELLQLYTDIRRLSNNKVIVGGDFNAKSRIWNSPIEDTRGIILAEWFASLDLVVVNRGNCPTFVRGSSKSFIDVTACTQTLARHISSWEVLLEENLSDHNSILFNLETNSSQVPAQEHFNLKPTWRFQEDKVETFQNRICETINAIEQSPEDTVRLIQNVCDEIFTRKTMANRRKPVYWWNSEISDLRKKCFTIKRRIVRGNGRRIRDLEDIERLKGEYHANKVELRKAIVKSQTLSWTKVCEDLNGNIWGTGYKIVCRKFKILNTKTIPTIEKLDVASKLFPEHKIEEWRTGSVTLAEIPPFTLDEVLTVCVNIKNKKAPGPDGIVPEIVKTFIKAAPDFCLKLFNDLLRQGLFPDVWKTAKLILIEKERKPTDTETSYRPICLLDALGKVFEKLIKVRLEEELDKSGGLAPLQFGFVAGKSAIDAMLEVKKLAKKAKQKKQLCVLTMVDVKNAFNSTPWRGILEELEKKNIPPYLVKIISSYFTNRNILVDNVVKNTSCGVPQGSVLGPVLWNVYYDPVLRLQMPLNTKTLAYADDLVLITTGFKRENIELEIRLAMIKINNWMRSKRLQLAPQKTEVIMLVSSRAITEVIIEVGENHIKSKDAAKYLGVVFDKNMRMTAHIKNVAEKAEKVATNLGRIMPNIKGPHNCKRKLLATVVYSTLFYGIPVWGEVLKFQKYRLKLEKVQRKVMIRQCRSYRTASTAALQVISGTLPIELMAEERIRMYEARKSNINMIDLKAELSQTLLRRWQNKWDQETLKGQWTKTLIKDIDPWVTRRHGDVTYELCQFLTGHGNFQAYLKKMNIKPDDRCKYCGETDTSEHMIFHCLRWTNQRTSCWARVGALSPATVIGEMLKSKHRWDRIGAFIENIVREKIAEDRQIQAAAVP